MQAHADILTPEAVAFIEEKWAASMPSSTPDYQTFVRVIRKEHVRRGFALKT